MTTKLSDITPGEYINWYNQRDKRTYQVRFMGWSYPDKRRLWIVHNEEWKDVSPNRCERINEMIEATLLPAHVLKIWRQDYGFSDDEIQRRVRGMYRQWATVGKEPKPIKRRCAKCGEVKKIKAKEKCRRCYDQERYQLRKEAKAR